jgi:hypothetical protein
MLWILRSATVQDSNGGHQSVNIVKSHSFMLANTDFILKFMHFCLVFEETLLLWRRTVTVFKEKPRPRYHGHLY